MTSASMQESSDGKWSFGLDAHFHLMMLARLGPHMALSAIFAQSSRADVLASLPPACPNFQPCFFLPFFFLGSYKNASCWGSFLPDSRLCRFFVCPLEAHWESKANCLQMHLKWPHLPLLSFQKHKEKEFRSKTWFAGFTPPWNGKEKESFIGKVCRIEIPQCENVHEGLLRLEVLQS